MEASLLKQLPPRHYIQQSVFIYVNLFQMCHCAERTTPTLKLSLPSTLGVPMTPANFSGFCSPAIILPLLCAHEM